MPITKPTTAARKAPTTNVDAFIAGAPDSAPTKKGVKKGNKVQISLTISPGLLDRIDALAADLGQSRAGIINLAIYRAVEHGLTIDGDGRRKI